jgi:hypothetical protein
MVGRHAGPDEAERGREAVEQVDFDRHVLGVQQVTGRVEAGRSGADDRDAQRIAGRAERHGGA